MKKWIIIVLAVSLALISCASNKKEMQPEQVQKAEITTKVAILPLKALDSSSRYITKILTVRDLELTFNKHAKYTLLDMNETAAVFKELGNPDVEDLEKEELDDLAKQLGADVVIITTVSETRADIFNVSMRMYSTISTDLKQISFNVGKEKTARWKVLEEQMMAELDDFVSNEIDKLFNIAANHFNNGNYTTAEQLLKQVIALKPEKIDAYYFLGNTYIKLEKLDLAEEYFLKALELQPDHQASIIALIDLYDKTNQPMKRIPLMERIAEETQDAETWFAIGNLYNQMDNKEKAKESYRKALAIDPEFSGANVNLSIILFDEGNYNEAIPYLEKAFEEAPDNTFIGTRLATAYQKSGRIQEAIDKYENLLSTDPNNIQAYLNLISIYRNVNDNAKAIEKINALKKIDPNNPYAYLNLAAIYLEQGKLNEAETNANITISKDHTLYQPYVILSAVYQSRGTESYNKYIDLDRQASRAVGKKATQLKKQRDTAKNTAINHLNKALNYLQTARSYTDDSEALNDINNRINRINQLLAQF
ncbi:MAG: tetratricopeptide repeat protein [Candidatus Cloacimonetes bacterium]|nr:tetratricopeptide repeat protein [Candidatus Cloacimonadota bacterium]